jgi:hypothetical protein
MRTRTGQVFAAGALIGTLGGLVGLGGAWWAAGHLMTSRAYGSTVR